MKEQIGRLFLAILIAIVFVFVVVAIICIMYLLHDIIGSKGLAILTIIVSVICTAIWVYKELGKP